MAGDAPGCEHRGKAGWGGVTQGFPHTTTPIIWEGFPNPEQKRDAGECTEHAWGTQKKISIKALGSTWRAEVFSLGPAVFLAQEYSITISAYTLTCYSGEYSGSQ